VAAKHAPRAAQQAWGVEPQERIFLATMRDAERTTITDAGYLRLFGLQPAAGCSAGDVWLHLLDSVPELKAEPFFRTFATSGPLARRLIRALGQLPDRARLQQVYAELCSCLAANRLFTP
ncbi:MAG: glutamate--cysteine ligase, partial [Gemmataceae bacterium]